MTTDRKGARTRAEVPKALLRSLQRGEAETRTLVEQLAIDLEALFTHVTGQRLRLESTGIVKRMAECGRLLPRAADHLGHPSDTVRGWAAFRLAAEEPDLARLLERMRPLAVDAHFGVREWAWMAARPHLAADLERGLGLLADWSLDPDPNARRFASELTRPRGVWCAHLEPLKATPALGLAVLEPLRSDPSRYVRDSVANWLNDASKTEPKWVLAVTKRWLRESPTEATQSLVKRARRSLPA